jgi:hypothetical protein
MSRSLAQDIGRLPHWARVAFAARCGRSALVLFRRLWPNAKPERPESLQTAVALAEQSAAAARPEPGLDRAGLDVVVTAGAALMPVYEPDGEEPYPADENACHGASFAAKAAEWAAKAAQGAPAESEQAALEALSFASDAAHRAGAPELVGQLERDVAGLSRVAARGRWSDATSVPPSVFGLLTEEPARRP